MRELLYRNQKPVPMILELGEDYGQRMNYRAILIDGMSYIPFDKSSYKSIVNGNVPLNKSKYVIYP